jgi:magnesium transporter
MITQQTHKGITWIDLESPTADEINDVAETFKLHPLTIKELYTKSERSKVDVYDHYNYLILHFPACEICYGGPGSSVRQPEELDIVLGKNFLITVHYEPNYALEEFKKIVETFLISRPKKDLHAGLVLFYLIRHLYQSLENGLTYLNSELKHSEDFVFNGHEREMVNLLADINHSIIDFRFSLKAHRDILNSLSVSSAHLFGTPFQLYIQAIIGEYERIWNMLESCREMYEDLRQTNESLLNIKINETIKMLTAITFISLPLSITIGLFGTNFKYVPFVNDPNGLPIVVFGMAIMVLFMYGIARYNEWL